MRTSNPALTDKAFSSLGNHGGEPMTIQGTVNKSFILLFLALITASWTWGQLAPTVSIGYEGAQQTINPTVMGAAAVGGIGAFIVALVTIFNKKWSAITAPMYALLEGFMLGAVSAMFEMSYPGIVVQAVALTFGTLFCLLAVYKSGLIKVTNNFRMGIVAATGAICLIYIANLVMGFFGSGIPMINGAGPIGIGFSVLVCGIAALNLVLDFDFIERGSQAGAPKYMEWYGAFGLMITLVWLYFEILRLLSKLQRR